MNQGVHVHSKAIVIDPFGKNPVVMTGSHNLGHKASTANDDNLMIVEGNAPLAAAYAANIIAIYQTYRWNTYVDAHAKDPTVWHGLADNDTWQDSYLAPTSPDLAEIKFWLGEGATAPAAAGQPVPAPPPGGTKVRAATATGRAKKSGKTAPAKKPGKKAAKTSANKTSANKTSAKKPAHKPKARQAAAARKRPTHKPKSKHAPAKRRHAA